MRQKSDHAVELPADSPPENGSGFSRRDFISRLAAISASLTAASPLLHSTKAAEQGRSKPDSSDAGGGKGSIPITLKVNGNTQRLVVDSRATLLDVLRDRLQLTGITEVHVPFLPWLRRSAYLKVRDRESYEFALTSAAVALDIDGDQIRDARIAIGGVGTKPWKLPAVRDALIGRRVARETFTSAAKLAVAGATPLKHNGFKVDLVQRTIVRALMNLGGVA